MILLLCVVSRAAAFCSLLLTCAVPAYLPSKSHDQFFGREQQQATASKRVARVAPHACKPGIACPRVEPTTAKPHRFVVRALANRRGTRHCLRSTEYIFYCPCFCKSSTSRAHFATPPSHLADRLLFSWLSRLSVICLCEGVERFTCVASSPKLLIYTCISARNSASPARKEVVSFVSVLGSPKTFIWEEQTRTKFI